MISNIQEINPLELLFQQYQPLDKQQLAELLGVSLNTVCKWLAGKRNPPAPTRKLAYLILQDLRSQPKAV
ncbi:MAG: helix-turn-helix domain-containing protein [Okeania sp. SIO2D1]|nr:helix-turn-helix domain-containing protein [Okeania sp. SIO2D1]